HPAPPSRRSRPPRVSRCSSARPAHNPHKRARRAPRKAAALEHVASIPASKLLAFHSLHDFGRCPGHGSRLSVRFRRGSAGMSRGARLSPGFLLRGTPHRVWQARGGTARGARDFLGKSSMIGVDFGGTQIKAGTVRDGVVTRSVVRATGAGAAPDVVLDAIAQAVLELDPAPRSVGLAIPGEVNAAGKVWRLPSVPGFEGVNIADELRRRIGEARVAVENDATAAALGERLYGHGRKAPSF